MNGNNNVGAAAINGSSRPREERPAPGPRRKKKKVKPLFSGGIMDLTFFFIIMALLVIGIVMMFSASYAWALNESGGESGTGYAVKQTIMAGIGLVAMLFFSYYDYHHFANPKIAIGLYGLCLVMLLLVFTPLGITHNGATRWLNLGIEFQPSELMKFAVIILFSYLIVQNYDKMNKFMVGVVPFAFLLGIIVLILMKQPHLSCTILICFTGVALMFVGGIRWSHIVLIVIFGVAALIGIVLWKSLGPDGFTYFFKRIQSWLHPFSDVTDTTYQTCQSLIAIGSGGPFGLGLGESRQKFMYLPETQNDFVFAIVCEELGFIGAASIIVLFALLVFRGLLISVKANDKFGMLLAVGITVQIGIQAFLNIAVVSNLIPNTGISLPFFSYGGTALIMQLAEVGVVLNISRQSAMEA